MYSDIILIGPPRTGKSTIGKLLADRLGVEQISLDQERWNYYKEIGYEEELAQRIRQTGGFVALVFYWKQFDAYAVERVLSEYSGCVFDFGAGHSVYESEELSSRVRRRLAPYHNIILILPAADQDESIHILNERTSDLVGSYGQGFNWNEYFIRHPGNYELAKFVVYTQGKTPEETCDEILCLVDLKQIPGDDPVIRAV